MTKLYGKNTSKDGDIEGCTTTRPCFPLCFPFCFAPHLGLLISSKNETALSGVSKNE